jgi:hypothetical protein
MDLMDEIADLRMVYRSLWLSEYTDHRLNSVLGRWDAEYGKCSVILRTAIRFRDVKIYVRADNGIAQRDDDEK